MKDGESIDCFSQFLYSMKAVFSYGTGLLTHHRRDGAGREWIHHFNITDQPFSRILFGFLSYLYHISKFAVRWSEEVSCDFSI